MRHNLRQSAKFKAKLVLWETQGILRPQLSVRNNAAVTAASKSTPIITELQILSDPVVSHGDEHGILRIGLSPNAPAFCHPDFARASAKGRNWPYPGQASSHLLLGHGRQPGPPSIVPVYYTATNPYPFEVVKESAKEGRLQDQGVFLRCQALVSSPQPGPPLNSTGLYFYL